MCKEDRPDESMACGKFTLTAVKFLYKLFYEKKVYTPIFIELHVNRTQHHQSPEHLFRREQPVSLPTRKTFYTVNSR